MPRSNIQKTQFNEDGEDGDEKNDDDDGDQWWLVMVVERKSDPRLTPEWSESEPRVSPEWYQSDTKVIRARGRDMDWWKIWKSGMIIMYNSPS